MYGVTDLLIHNVTSFPQPWV